MKCTSVHVVRADHPRSCGANPRPVSQFCHAAGSSPLVRGQLMFPILCGGWWRIIPARAGPTTTRLFSGNGMADHPRSCGANTMVGMPVSYMVGSSPLVRGQHDLPIRPRDMRRIIPARAGPTYAYGYEFYRYPDHPRSCGANERISVIRLHNDGSSPLVRGQLIGVRLQRFHKRIIPARAGPTCGRNRSNQSRTDHPRSCGANRISRHAISCYSGSSPLVRGQRWPVVLVVILLRIIPARAGPTRLPQPRHRRFPDHPRSCGANDETPREDGFDDGSSPLVRGQQHRALRDAGRPRIIPARAGPTSADMRGVDVSKDHPRSCGANANCSVESVLSCGSSPLVRGQRRSPSSSRTRPRIIPARAGPTGIGCARSHSTQDHPRSCGANTRVVQPWEGRTGSSPLVRGQLSMSCNVVTALRIIPARAGPTRPSNAMRLVGSDHPRSCGAN